MPFNGHIVGLLKTYMTDLVEQARQEQEAHRTFGFAQPAYRADQALSDLLAILDDRIESEGVQIGLPHELLHDMWTICNEARPLIQERVWLELSATDQPSPKSQVRETTYRVLIEYLEEVDRRHGNEPSS